MKRLTFLLVILVFVIALNANTNELIFRNFHVPPTIIEDITYYDYMPGGYDGYPMQLQEESDYLETGIYFTYMSQPSALAERQQAFAFAWRDPVPDGQVLHRQLVTSYNFREGFGTLQVDLANQSVIFVWHSTVTGTGLLNTYFTWDAFSEAEYPGWGLYERAVLSNNNTPEAIDRRHEFNWPVILMGPSPLPNHRRAYVFHSNNGRSLMELPPGSSAAYAPSSNHLITFADVSNYTYTGEIIPETLVWTHRYVPYLERLHNWVPNNPPPDDPDDRYFARAMLGYAVAPAGPYAGYVALAGQVSGDTGEDWNDHDAHDHIVLLATDYLEYEDTSAGTDLPYGVFREYPFQLRRVEDDIQGPMRFNPDEVALLPQDAQDLIHNEFYNNSADNFFFPLEWREQIVRFRTVNHKTLTFDRKGRLHIPSIADAWWSDISADPGYGRSYTYSWTIQNLIFDLTSQDIKFANVYPKSYDAEMNQFLSDRILFPWDMNDDGWVDLNYDFETNTIYSHFTPMWPYNFHEDDNEINIFFHQNQQRLTGDNNGLMALMWIDSKEAKMEEMNPGTNTNFLTNPEIMIAISRDSGTHWSYPYHLSVVSNPEIGTAAGSLAYVYPAEKIIRVDENTARVYFMYMDDNSWGSYGGGGETPQGQNHGGSIRYTAIDFDLSNLPVSEKDIETPVVHRMLAQNFPNPFNPTTNIQFNLPADSDVKLSVYNVRGQLVNTLLNDSLIAGSHQVTWNGTDNNNRSVASGIYFYRLEANGQNETRRMILMK